MIKFCKSLLVLSILLASCATATQTEIPTEIVAPSEAIAEKTSTPIPPSKSSSTATLVSTSTPSQTVGPTATLNPTELQSMFELTYEALPTDSGTEEVEPTYTPLPLSNGAVPLSSSAISLRFGLPDLHELGPSNIAASPGKVWVGFYSSQIDVFADDGTFLNSIVLNPISDPIDESNNNGVVAIRFDGQQMWVLCQRPADLGGDLYAINPFDYSMITHSDIPEGNEPFVLGLSPGKLWVGGNDFYQIFDSNTGQPLTDLIFVSENLDVEARFVTSFAFDGTHWMWVGYEDAPVVVNVDSADLLPVVSSSLPVSEMLASGAGKIWGYSTFKDMTLYAAQPDPAGQLLLQVLLTDLWQDCEGCDIKKMVIAKNYLWALDDISGFLHQHDLGTGNQVSQIPIIVQGESETNQLIDLSDDGTRLWILTDIEVVRVDMP